MTRVAWYMRGGVTMSELLDLSQNDYAFFTEVIEENMDMSKKTKQLII